MKKMIVAAIAAALVIILCSCEPGIFYPITTDAPETTQKSETEPVTEEKTEAPETEPQPVTTEAETEAPVTEIGEYTVIDTALIAHNGSSGTLRLYSDNTYTAELTLVSGEFGVEFTTVNTERGTYETSDGINLVCSCTDILVKISFKSESDKKEEIDSLKLLCDIDMISFEYVESFERACGKDGYSATVREAENDPFLSTFLPDGETKVFLDKEKTLAYDVTVKYDLPDGSYRIEEEGCVLTLDPDGKAGECSLEFALYGDDGDELGPYSDITVLKGTYKRNGSVVTCTINCEITFLKYDSPESQQLYLANLEELFGNGHILEEVYNYNKAVASEEGRYLDYGGNTDEYVAYVIDITHAAVFTSSPSQEYQE